jgi:hypothetical protein
VPRIQIETPIEINQVARLQQNVHKAGGIVLGAAQLIEPVGEMADVEVGIVVAASRRFKR